MSRDDDIHISSGKINSSAKSFLYDESLQPTLHACVHIAIIIHKSTCTYKHVHKKHA